MLNHKEITVKSIQERKQGKKWFIIEPTSTFRGLWNILMIFFIIYTGLVVPYRISFLSDEELNSVDIHFIIEICIDVCFSFDLFINFITAYERPDGEIEYRVKRIALNYLTGFFIIDFISVFPFHLFEDLVVNDDSVYTIKPGNLLKLLRL